MAEQTLQMGPIKAQSTAIARAMASICNAEGARLRGMSGHVRLPVSLSAHSRERGLKRRLSSNKKTSVKRQGLGRLATEGNGAALRTAFMASAIVSVA